MSFQNENIGMMDEGYFVPRGQILKWLNDLLQLNLTKIEQLGSGAVYCQVIDVIHPGKIALNKVNWKAKNDYEFINNLKILQQSFNKVGIKRHLEVEKLSKAKYQDNLEFAQWLKRYYDLNCGDRGNNYQAQERRGGLNPDFGFAQKIVIPKTYNGTGVMIPNKNPPEKKQLNQQSPPPPPPPKKISSPSNIPAKNQYSEPRPKKVEKIQKKIQQVANIQQEKSIKRQQQLLLKVKSLQQKLLMISDVLNSEEASDVKVEMISLLMKDQQQLEKEEDSL